MRTLLGVTIGITATILWHRLWRPLIGWALSQGDTCTCCPKGTP